MKDLKPCPFCGGEAVYAPSSVGSGNIACVDCHMETKKFWDEPIYGETKIKWHEYAAEAWNRRTDDATD